MQNKNRGTIYVLRIQELDYSVRYPLETFRTRWLTTLISTNFRELFCVARALVPSVVSSKIYELPFGGDGVMNIDRVHEIGVELVSFINGYLDAYFRIKFLFSKRDNYPYPDIIEVNDSCRHLLIEYQI
jgi:hypothetical protein